MKSFSSRALLASLWLALLPLLAVAGTPVLTLQATVATGTGVDATAFVDQVEIVNVATGLVVVSAVPNGSFESSTPLANGSYGYNPTGAGWGFVSQSGIASNGSPFSAPTTSNGARVAFLQSSNVGVGSFSQTLPSLPAGLYQVRLQAAQRGSNTTPQGVQVLVNGTSVGTTVPGAAFASYTSASFAVDPPVLRLEATVAAGAGVDVTAFVDAVEIINVATGLPVTSAVPNAGFETFTSLNFGTYGYNPAGATWAFANSSGIATDGSPFGSPNAPDPTHVAFLQSTTSAVGFFSQTLPGLATGTYQVRLQAAQRNTAPANQGVRVLIDGVVVGLFAPTTAGFASYSSNSFTIGPPLLSSLAPTVASPGAVLTLNGLSLQGATSIAFSGAAGTKVVTSGFVVNAAGTQITGVVVPPGAQSGPVTVTTPQGTSPVLEGLFFTRARLLAAGTNHTAQIRANGSLWTWGRNINGQLGDGTTTNRPTPGQVGTATSWVSVAATTATAVTAAVQANGTLWTWGNNPSGQLGDGTTNTRLAPGQVGTATKWASVSPAKGGGFLLAVQTNGTLWGWGNNSTSQFGDGTTTDRLTPGQIGAATSWVSAAAANSYSLGIQADGTLWAWGLNTNGQLGDGTTTSRSTPGQVGAGTTWASVTAGDSHTVALRADGTLWAWGLNANGQLGDGTTTSRPVPTQVGTDSNWLSVEAGVSYTLAVKLDGSLWAWGLNNNGQLGDGTLVDKASPVQVSPATGWVRVAAGTNHSLAEQSCRTLLTWGLNTYGQLGDGSTTNRPAPVLAYNPSALLTFSPARAVAGTSVTVTGTALAGLTALTVNGVSVALSNVSNASDVGFTFVVPAGATTTGTTTASVGCGVASSTAFMVSPVIGATGLSPTSGPVGTSVTITGTNLDGATSVSFNGTAQTTITANTATSLTVTVPAGATTGPVTVTTASGTSAASAQAFTVLPPTISSFLPASGAAGTSIALTGTNLTGATAVSVNGVAVTPTAVTATSLSFVVPAGASATPSITVTTPGGTSAASTAFTVLLQALTVSPTSPVPNTRAAPIAGSAVAVSFTEAISSGTAGNLAVFGGIAGGRKAGIVSGGGSSTLSFSATASTPVSSFQRGEVVSVSVPGTVLSTGGLAAPPFVYQFTAGGLTASSGTFTDRLDVPASGGASPRHARWADFDGDGKPDLLAANKNLSSFSVTRNTTTTAGSPTFAAVTSFNVYNASSSEPYAAAAGDADGDGRPDVATANRRAGSVSVRRNSSTGVGNINFVTNAEWAVGGLPQEIQWADLDGDGRQDLVTVNTASNNVSVLRNTSTGVGSINFDAALSFALSAGSAGSDNLRAADLDGDGKLDLVLNNAGGTALRVLRNTSTPGTLSFVAGTDVNLEAGSTPYGPALADVDGDDRLDLLAVGASQGKAYVLLNTGAPGSISFAGYVPLVVGSSPAFITGADLNGDGKPDLAVANNGGTLSVLLNTSTATGSVSFGAVASYPLVANSGPSGLMAADADGDGLLDLAVANSGAANSVSIFLNTPNAPTITALNPTTGPVGTSVSLTGTNLTGATAITFSGTSGNVVTTGFTVASPTSITGVVVPAGAVTGTLSVTTPIGTNLAAGPVFTVTPSLSGLVVSAGTLSPTFAGSTTSYTLSPTASATTTVTPTNAQTSGGTITVNGTVVASGTASGAITLNPGTNTLTIVVNPAGAGTARTYTVTLTRCVVTATARNLSLTLDATGNASTTAAAVNNGSSSTCGAVTATLSQTAFTCANVGANAVTLTVTDNYGGSSTAPATVTVTDTTPPVFASNGAGTSASPFTTLNGARGVATGTYWFRIGGNTFQGYVDGSTDGGGWVEIMNYVHAGGTNPAINTRTTSLPVQTSAVLGADESAVPAAWGHAAPALVNALNPLEVRFSGQTSGHSRVLDFKTSLANVLSYLKTGTGNTNGLGPAGTFTALPGHTALLPASRNNGVANQGNTALTDFTFMRDNIGYWAVRGYSLRWEMDDFSAYQTVSADGYARSTIHRAFARGSATTAPGNNVMATAAAGLCGTAVDLTGTQPVLDNCAGTTVTFSPASGSFFAVGTTAVTATATDASGNTATSAFTVTVTEPQLPTAVAQNLSVTLDASGTASITAAQVNNGSSDNCTAAANLTLSVSPGTFTCANLGANTVTLTVADASGNQSTSTATVTVSAPALTSTTWTGAASTDWTACANWSYGLVPTAAISAMLPAGMPRYPSLPTGTYPVLDLTIASGASLTTVSGATLQVSGNFANNGGTATLAGPVQFGGTATSQSIGGTSATSFATVTVNKASGSLSLGRDLSVSGPLTLTSGTLTTGASYKVTLGSTATLSESETSYVSGTVETTRTLSTAGTGSSFGGLGLTLTPAAASTALPGSTLVRRVTDSPATGVGSSVGIKRYFVITPTVDANLNVTMVLAYFDHELNGIAENKLLLFKSESGATGPWARVDYASYDAPTNTVTRANIASLSTWTLGNADAPLPVELLAFTAEKQGSAVQLTWRTASEKNSARFEVERSRDGKAFEKIGQEQAQGTKASLTAYAFLDDHPLLPPHPPTLYYRLRQVDLDSTASYSPVRAVAVGGKGLLTLYPNPAHSAVAVAGLPAGASVEVLDALGRAVARATVDAGGSARLALPAGLAAGVYVVRSGTQVQRLAVE
jgi:alpha-tubulin suppressor-like RCC1 family protein